MPRVRAIHQIEITSRCNLACVYCTNRNLKRPKVDISIDVFKKALAWVKRFGQHELNLAGIGESTLHPLFVELMAMAREALPDINLVMATNGLLMTPELARAIAPFKPTVYVSLHRPEKAGRAIEALKAVGLLAGVSADPSIASTNWAGQVDWPISHPPNMVCQWIPKGQVMLMADGNITSCSFDASGSGIVGTIDDPLDMIELKPFKLCETCSYIKGW